MESAGLKAGKEEQKKALEIMLQIAAEASKATGKTGVYYWEPVGVPDCGFGSWFANMGICCHSGLSKHCVDLLICHVCKCNRVRYRGRQRDNAKWSV